MTVAAKLDSSGEFSALADSVVPFTECITEGVSDAGNLTRSEEFSALFDW
ncbi:MAG: hypothetical protein J0I12_10980 [Candidatus Eremiobacteraeota bacterium]|nr:hypothetical protein [Candidatus Eremiobacteraeota bacterium]